MLVPTQLPLPLIDDIERAKIMKDFALTDVAKARLKRSFCDKSVEVYPGIYSDSDKYKNFLREVTEFSTPEPCRDRYPMGPYAEDLRKARCIPGTTVLPLSYVQKTVYAVKEKNERMKYFLRKISKIAFSGRNRTYGRISKDSSLGFPYCTAEEDLKKKLLMRMLTRIDRVEQLVMKDDFEGLYRDFEILFLSSTQVRRQPDKFGKRRDIHLFESTIENPVEIKDERPVEEFEPMRTRVVYAFSWCVNILCTVFGDGLRSFMDEYLAPTFKHKGKDDICDKVNKMYKRFKDFDLKSLDYSRYDTTMKKEHIEIIIDSMPIPDFIKKMSKWMLVSPHYSSDDGRGFPLLDGNPLKSSDFVWFRGNPSGWWATSCVGKLTNMAFVLTCIESSSLFLFYNYSEQEVDNHIYLFLVHRHPKILIACCNMSDDMLMGGSRTQLSRLINAMINMGIFVVEVEDDVKFLGWIIFYVADGDYFSACLSLQSYLVGEVTPEKSISDSFFRPYWAIGMISREAVDVYGSNPYLLEFKEYKNRVALKHFGWTIDSMLSKYRKDPSGGIDAISSDIIADPSRLLWKYNNQDLEKYEHLISQFSSAILPEVVEPYISKYLEVA